jgi:hypothetical protein
MKSINPGISYVSRRRTMPERESCLLVLNSVTSTPQWIRCGERNDEMGGGWGGESQVSKRRVMPYSEHKAVCHELGTAYLFIFYYYGIMIGTINRKLQDNASTTTSLR